ncbi:MAG: hypothetical protein HYY84_18735 [Deltaproteobacteria bacterium]|nr:hypothetical protein [Deltaproteobacteria bacterium]
MKRFGFSRLLAGSGLVLVVAAVAGGGDGCSTSTKQAPGAAEKKADAFDALAAPKLTEPEKIFKFEKGPKPPGQTFEKVGLAFPPPLDELKPVVKREELKVLRTQPSGSEGLVGAITVTFNQAMVPLASLQDLKGFPTPLDIEPKIAGRYRWLGTTTLSFEPEGRAPFSTRYKARVPAGTKAASGSVLETEVAWEFTTPRPKVVTWLPYRGSSQVKPDAAIAMLFNQAIKPAQAFEHVKVSGPREIALMRVPEADWKGLKDIGAQVTTWDKTRTLIVKPTAPLALASSFMVIVKPGLEGEGPLVVDVEEAHSFSTYGPLRVTSLDCGWRSATCYPGAGLRVEFTNGLASGSAMKAIAVSPEVPGGEVSAWGSNAWIRGATKAATKYTVKVAGDIEDVFGQKLGAPWSGSITIGNASPSIEMPREIPAVVEGAGDKLLAIGFTNIPSAHLQIAPIPTDNIAAALQHQRTMYQCSKRDPFAKAGERVVDKTISPPAKPNERARFGIDLKPALRGAPSGFFVVNLASEKLHCYDKSLQQFATLVAVTDIGLTARYALDKGVALVAGLASGKALLGAKVRIVDAAKSVLWEGATNDQGVAEFPGVRGLRPAVYPMVLIAEKDGDTAFLELAASGVDGYLGAYSYGQPTYKERLATRFFTDRSPYRPGDTVHFKALLRVEEETTTGAVKPWPADYKKAKVHVTSNRGETIVDKKEVDIVGGAFALDIAIPKGASLGQYSIQVTIDGARYPLAGPVLHYIRVEEYRTPEYEVKVEPPTGPLFFGDVSKWKVKANYYFGAPMTDADAKWTLRRQEASYVPPGPHVTGFSFGDPFGTFDWGWRHRFGMRGGRYGHYFESTHATSQGALILEANGKTNEKGEIEVEKIVEKGEMKPGKVGSFTLEAEVYDKNRQAIAGRASMIVHNGAVYAGLRSPKTVVEEGQAVRVEAIAVGLDGKRLAGVKVAIEGIERRGKWIPERRPEGYWTTRYEEKEVRIGGCDVVSTADPVPCAVTLPRAGSFTIRARVEDGKGRKNETAITAYAYGKGNVYWHQEDRNRVDLVPDRTEYAPGDTARVLVKSPFPRAVGLLTIERYGIAEYRPLVFNGSAAAVEVSLKAEWIPNVRLAITLSRGRLSEAEIGAGGAEAAADLGKPAFAQGSVNLAIEKSRYKLTVGAKPASPEIAPGTELPIEISTTGHDGKPVSSEVAVMIVDEGVLALLGFATPDPFSYFWGSKPPMTAMNDLRRFILKRKKELQPVSKPPPPVQRRSRAMNGRGHDDGAKRDEEREGRTGALPPPSPGGGYGAAAQAPKVMAALASPAAERAADKKEASGGEAAPALVARTLFASTAYFNPAVKTGADGRAKIVVKMPENLTTFRIMAVAHDREVRFGSTSDTVKVRKPLLLRASLPRFANFGDAFEASVVVNNETGNDTAVDVQLRAANTTVEGEGRERVHIKNHEAKEIRFRVKVKDPGTAKFQFAAQTVGAGKKISNDAVEVAIPIKLPATSEAFATYGATDKSIAQPLLPPKEIVPDFGGLEMSFSSTALTGLTDAVKYLIDYPYECAEQTASRIIPIVAMKDIIRDFPMASLKDPTQVRTIVESGVRRLRGMQQWDGGFSYWPGAHRTWLWISSWVTFALELAKTEGFEVPQSMLDNARRFLKNRLDSPRLDYDALYSYTTQVFAAYVLSLSGSHATKHLDRLYGVRKELPLFGKAFLLAAIHRANHEDARRDELLREIGNAAVETPAAAHFAEAKTESLRLLMHSDERTDAIVLLAYLEADPKQTLVPKIMKGLMDARRRGGRWRSTQENAYGLLAFSRYYKLFEKEVPDFTASVWIGDGYVGREKFEGRSMRVVEKIVPMSFFTSLGQQTLTLAKDGPGRLYYRLGLKYAPASLKLPPEEQGFAVSRVYEPVEGPETVRRDDSGVWHIKAGANVRVRLTIVVPDRRHFVAVDDPLPAGLEGVNLTFQTTAQGHRAKLQHKTYDFWRSYYALWAFDHKEMRDDRVVLFADMLPAGVYEYTYLARATTYGRFVTPPLKAEEMYAPEVFGRNGTDIVVVE